MFVKLLGFVVLKPKYEAGRGRDIIIIYAIVFAVELIKICLKEFDCVIYGYSITYSRLRNYGCVVTACSVWTSHKTKVVFMPL